LADTFSPTTLRMIDVTSFTNSSDSIITSE
jgi:hypothetical protein